MARFDCVGSGLWHNRDLLPTLARECVRQRYGADDSDAQPCGIVADALLHTLYFPNEASAAANVKLLVYDMQQLNRILIRQGVLGLPSVVKLVWSVWDFASYSSSLEKGVYCPPYLEHSLLLDLPPAGMPHVHTTDRAPQHRAFQIQSAAGMYKCSVSPFYPTQLCDYLDFLQNLDLRTRFHGDVFSRWVCQSLFFGYHTAPAIASNLVMVGQLCQFTLYGYSPARTQTTCDSLNNLH
eukprot:TRINITY_DN936_c0_g1_i1.p1 TRINITY_DN936_c0_g1~~TRINITY_DN936_c0_g1_i1.p1  ORF type:complete len:250 (+),score=41.41 TRINITY_DN936_c0_g1_i1:37-750(+)